jgi:peptidoglycan/xylan/chitin deacetylase (PgdA/CDA1 family)
VKTVAAFARRAALGLTLATACGTARAAGAATPVEWAGVPVLMYHKVDPKVPSDAVGRDLTVAPERFAAELRWLRAHRIRTLTAAELIAALARGERPQRAVVLTFDDGYADAATSVLPLLRANGAHATFYVSSGFVGTPRHLSWRQMRELRAAGNELACHGTFHLDLATLDRAGQEREARHCVESFAHYLGGFRPVTYAYPAGKYDATTFAVMRSLALRGAFTEIPGTVRDLARPFELPRRRVRRDDDVATFGALATP